MHSHKITLGSALLGVLLAVGFLGCSSGGSSLDDVGTASEVPPQASNTVPEERPDTATSPANSPISESKAERLRSRAERLLRQSDRSDNELALRWTIPPRNTSLAGTDPEAEFTFRIAADGTGDLKVSFSDISRVIDYFGLSTPRVGGKGPADTDYTGEGDIDFSDIRKVVEFFGTGVSGFNVYQDQSPNPSTKVATLGTFDDKQVELTELTTGEVRVNFTPPEGTSGYVKLVPLNLAGHEVPSLASPVLQLHEPPKPEQWEVTDERIRDEGMPEPLEYHALEGDRLLTFIESEDADIVQLWNTEPNDDQIIDQIEVNTALHNNITSSNWHGVREAIYYLSGSFPDDCSLMRLTVTGNQVEKEKLFDLPSCGNVRVPTDDNTIIIAERSTLSGYNLETGEQVWQKSLPGLPSVKSSQLTPPNDRFIYVLRSRFSSPDGGDPGPTIFKYFVDTGQLAFEGSQSREYPPVCIIWDEDTLLAGGISNEENFLIKLNAENMELISTFSRSLSGKRTNLIDVIRNHNLVLGSTAVLGSESDSVVPYPISGEPPLNSVDMSSRVMNVSIAPDFKKAYVGTRSADSNELSIKELSLN